MQKKCKTMQEAKTRTVGVLLFPEFSNLCLANAIEPLRAANRLSRRPLYRWHHLSVDAGAVRSSSGLPVQPEARLREFTGGDYLFVMPSYGYRSQGTVETLRALRAARKRFATLVGMDTGALMLAAAGLLEGRHATAHWDELTRLSEDYPEVQTSTERFVIDGDVITCGGATTTLDLMLELIRAQHGAMLSLEVSALFMHGERPPRTDPLHRLTRDQLVRAAAALMRRHIEDPLSMAQIAGHLGVSPRHLEKHCRQVTGRSPGAIYRAIRLHDAARMVEQTTLSITEIATRVGYRDASAMTRAFRTEYGQPPTAWRRT